jgi:hypothetical protein
VSICRKLCIIASRSPCSSITGILAMPSGEVNEIRERGTLAICISTPMCISSLNVIAPQGRARMPGAGRKWPHRHASRRVRLPTPDAVNPPGLSLYPAEPQHLICQFGAGPRSFQSESIANYQTNNRCSTARKLTSWRLRRVHVRRLLQRAPIIHRRTSAKWNSPAAVAS